MNLTIAERRTSGSIAYFSTRSSNGVFLSVYGFSDQIHSVCTRQHNSRSIQAHALRTVFPRYIYVSCIRVIGTYFLAKSWTGSIPANTYFHLHSIRLLLAAIFSLTLV